MPNTMLTIRIRADMRFKVCSTLLNHSLPTRDALTRVFQGMPVCQVIYKETLTTVWRILQFSVSTVGETHGAAVLMALQFSSLPSWAAPAFLLVGAAVMALQFSSLPSWATPAFLLVGAAVSTHNRLSASRCHCTTVADSSAQGATRTTALLLS